MSISVKRVLAESSKFTSVSVLSKLMSMPVMVFLGRRLTPEDFGVVASITLILQYASLASPGFTNASAREIAHYYGEGDEATAKRIESVANGADILFAAVVCTAIVGAAFMQTAQVRVVGFVIIAGVYLAERLKNYYYNANYYRQQFNVNVSASTVGSLASPLTSAGLVVFIGKYALLAAPLAASLSVVAYYAVRSKQRICFRWDFSEAVKLFKVGVVLSMAGLAFWGLRLADRTAITMFLPAADLGYYFYAMSYVLMALNILADFGRVLESMIWTETGKTADSKELRRDVKKLSLFIACAGAAAIPILQLGYYLVVFTMVPKFRGTTGLFNVLSLGIYPAVTCMVPSSLLTSKRINRQHLVLWVYSGAAALSFIAYVVAIKLGYGLDTIAWLSVGSVCLVSVWLVVLARDCLSSSAAGFAAFIGKLLVPFAASIVAWTALSVLRQRFAGGFWPVLLSFAVCAFVYGIVFGALLLRFPALIGLEKAELRRMLASVRGWRPAMNPFSY
jgi:O-antigen/teichoic acid export membrane protein